MEPTRVTTAVRATRATADVELFRGLCAVARPVRAGIGVLVSSGLHVAVAACLVVGYALWPASPPPLLDPLRVLVHDRPPAPPPLPLPLGRGMAPARPGPRPATPPSAQAAFEAPRPGPGAEELEPALPAVPPITEGSPGGSDGGTLEGSEEGMAGGVVGGVPGGLPGGLIGGAIGGAGNDPLPVLSFDYDRPPTPIRAARPAYPDVAFVQKIEGTVELAIVIGADGRVVSVTVVRSIPQLDAAAIEAVRHWLFRPALRRGQPVATRARVPITFRIY